MGIVEAMVLAFLGGALLNLMPCVLPVLAVKVTALASMGEHSTGERLRHGLGYGAGILVSMAGLAGAITVLKLAGEAVGWGFQFQQPVFVVGLSAVMVLFALNLLGVYEFGVPRVVSRWSGPGAGGQGRSFFEGVLAVVLATPCTAPFMGTAVGFAMASHPAVIFAVFLSLGLGLSAPFVAVALIPAFYRVIPKPGAWMEVMKNVLGFALLLTALWLVWLMGRLTGLDGVTGLLGFLLALSFGAWAYGSVQYRMPDRVKSLAMGAALVALGSGAYWGLGGIPEPGSAQALEGTRAVGVEAGPAVVNEKGEINWLAWTPTMVEEFGGLGRPAFVNFTADWCISCKANEREVISTAEVISAAVEANVAMIKADLTHMDEEILAELESFGRSGVPFYLYYDGSGGEPEILPQVLTRSRLVAAFQGRSE